MAWGVNDLYEFVKRLIRKNQAGGVSANDIFYFWNSEQTAYISDLLGRFQRINNGKEGNNTGLIENETILTKLTPFTKPATIAISSGKVTKPSDFLYALDLRISGKKVFPINKDQIYFTNEDVIDPPSTTDGTYYRTEYEDYFSILPSTATGNAALDYVAIPKDIRWAFTLDTNGRQVYNVSGITEVPVIYGGVGYTTPTIAFSAPAAGGVQATGTLTVVGGVITAVVMTNVGYGYAGLTPTFTITGSSTTPANLGSPIVSVQPQWNQIDIVEITKRALKSLGVSFKDSDFTNFGNSVIQSGD